MTAPENIRKLVETFEQNLSEYHTRKNLTSAKTPHRESVGKVSMQRQVESTDNWNGEASLWITMDNSITKKQLTTLALIGLVILALFAAGFVWLYYYVGVLGNGGGEVVLALSPFWVFPYLVIISVYVGFFAARFAKGRWKHAWLWGIAGFALTLLFILGFPSLLSPVFPYQGPTIFARPAIFAFLAPVLSALLIVLLISIRRKATL